MRRILLVLLLALAACGKDDVAPSSAGDPTTTTSTLPALPAYGLVLDATEPNASHSVAVVLDLDGHEIARLEGWRTYLDGPIEDPSGAAYRVDPTTHALVPDHTTDHARVIDLPPPPRAAPDSGHWESAFDEPGGDRILATWSGECEIPAAFVVEADRSMHPVRGTDLSDAPESFALGWAPDGRAVVSFDSGGCGDAWKPGTYLVDLDHAGATPVQVSPYYYGFLWTP